MINDPRDPREPPPLDDDGLDDDELPEGEGDEGQEQAGEEGLEEEAGEGGAGEEPEGRPGQPARPAAAQDGVRREPGRRERAVLAAKREAREAREEAARVRNELEEFRRNLEAQRQQPNEAEERARFAAMDPLEQVNYRINQLAQLQERSTRSLETSFREQTDKASFQVLLAQTPSYRKYEAQVETIYAQHAAEAKRLGTRMPDRATILPWVIGRENMKAMAKVGAKARKTGATNIARQTVTAASPRGDVSAQSRLKTLEERLADVTF